MANKFLNLADVKYTFRLLAKNPGFTLLSVIVLALGLGLSIFTFTMSYTIAYKPIPLANGDSIYHICAGAKRGGCRPFNAYEFAQLRDQISTLENIGIFTSAEVFVEHDNQARAATAARTEWNMFRLSGSNALLGRTLQAYDHRADAEPVAVLEYGLWQSMFNGDREIIDEVVNIEGKATRIVGVMPEGYRFPDVSRLWLPVSNSLLEPLENERVFVSAFALLKNSESVKSADAEMGSLMQRIRLLYPYEPDPNVPEFMQRADPDTGHIVSLPMRSMGGIEGLVTLAVFNLLAGLIFLLACINTGTLLLARTNERLKDLSIRVALGAPRFRLLLQTMGESIAISVLGGAMALLVAGAGLELLNLYISYMGGGQFWWNFRIDGSTLLAVLLFVLLTILLTSVIPGWRIINRDFNAALRDGTRGAVGLKSGRFSQSLVMISIVLITLVLFTGAISGSLMQSIKQNLSNVNSENILSTRLSFDPERYAGSQRSLFYQSLMNSLGQNQAIEDVLALGNRGFLSIETEVIGQARERDYANAVVHPISGSLYTLGVTLLEGRFLNQFDSQGGSPAVLVSRSLAERLWPGESAVGRQLRIRNGQPGADAYPWSLVVGVVSNTVIYPTNLQQIFDRLYMPLDQTEAGGVDILVKHNGDADTAEALLRQSILALDAETRFTVRNMEEVSQTQVRAANAAISLIFGCGLFSFLVAIAGIFGLATNDINLHTQDIGTRRALGASDGVIRRTFLLKGSRKVVAGFLVAMLIAAPLTYLFILASGAVVLKVVLLSAVAVFGMLSLTVFLAIYYPIYKVLELEPADALRYE